MEGSKQPCTITASWIWKKILMRIHSSVRTEYLHQLQEKPSEKFQKLLSKQNFLPSVGDARVRLHDWHGWF